jgi:hypothetical protein
MAPSTASTCRGAVLSLLGRSAAALLGIVWLVGCEDVHRIRLKFEPNQDPASPVSGLDGFLCHVDPTPTSSGVPPFLAEAALQGSGRAEMSLVVDFLKLGGTPDTHFSEIVGWCMSHGCTPLPSARRCQAVPLPLGPGQPPAPTAIMLAIQALAGGLIATDAPLEPTIVRVFASAQGCAELPAAGDGKPRLDKLLGCAFSNPVLLGAINGDLVIDLPSVGTPFCAGQVYLCANDFTPPAP